MFFLHSLMPAGGKNKLDMKKIINILLLVISLCGCYSQQKYMDAMKGWDKTAVIYNLGPPNSRQPDGSGGEVLIYSQVKYFAPPPGSYGTMGQNIQYLKYVYFDSSGRMTYWRTERRQVAPGQMEVIIR